MRALITVPLITLWALMEESPKATGLISQRDQQISHATRGELTEIVARGRSLFNTGRYEECRRHFEQGLRRVSTLGPVSESIVLAWLGFSYSELGRWADAERTLVRCVALRERLWGSGNELDLSHARILTALAGVQVDLGRYDQAEKHFEAASRIWKSLPGSEQIPEFASHLNGLGMLRFEQGRYSDAASLLQKALMLLQLSTPVGDRRRAQLLAHLAVVLSCMNRHSEADALSTEALTGFTYNVDREPRVQAELLMFRAFVLLKAKRRKEAQRLEHRAEEIRRRSGIHHSTDVRQLGARSRQPLTQK